MLDCPPATLAPGATLTCTATYITTPGDEDRGFITDIATATGTPPADPAVTGTSNPVTVTAVQHPVIEILKKASPTEYHAAGETIRYTFTVINDGNVTLHGITVTDNRLGTISCPPATLAPGGMATCTATHCTVAYTVTQADVNAGHITNTATVTGTHGNSGMPTKSLPVSATILLRPASSATIARARAVPQSPLPQALIAVVTRLKEAATLARRTST